MPSFSRVALEMLQVLCQDNVSAMKEVTGTHFLLYKNLLSPVFLSLPWLQNDAPVIDWNTAESTCWGTSCH